MSELEKLKKYLDEHGYVNEWNDRFSENDQIIVYKEFDGTDEDVFAIDIKEPLEFVKVFDKWFQRSWDVICHPYSYGGERGLLEIYGEIVNNDGGVEGWLTATDVIKKYLEDD